MQCAPQVLRDFPREITPKKSLMPGCEGQNLFCSRSSRRRRRSRRWGSRRRRRRRRRGGREPIKDFWQPPPIHPGGIVALLKTTKNYKKMSTSKHLKRSKKYHGLLEEAGSLKKSDYSGSFLDLFVRFAQLFGRCFCLVVFAMMPDDSYPVMVDSVRMDDGDGGDSEGTKSQQHWRIAQKGQRGSKGEHKERSMSAVILLLDPPIPVCHMSVTVFYRISHVWAWTLDAHCSPI